MTSDINIINAVVTAIQGNSISSSSPTDGYVLTWNAADGYWEPKSLPSSSSSLHKDYFVADNNWTCPDGIYNIICIGAGGGSGGGGGATANSLATTQATGGAGGAGVIESIGFVQVSPGLVYSIKIGNGGLGGLGGISSSSGNAGSIGSNGENTEFKNNIGDVLFSSFGSLPGGGGVILINNDIPLGGSSNIFDSTGISTNGRIIKTFSYGGDGNPNGNAAGINGGVNSNNIYTAGLGGASSGLNFVGAGSGGGAGPNGNGGNGGTGSSLAHAFDGYSADDNSGAGGGGGSAASNGFNGGNGGSGGSGYLFIIY